MKRFAFLILLFSCLNSFAQKNAADSSKALADSALSNLDLGSGLLSELSQNACKCIRKISIKNKSAAEISKAISKCIEEQSMAYEMGMKLMETLSSKKKSDTIFIDPSGKNHNKYYFEIEGWLRDSCEALSYIIAANNKESEFSMSSNKTALKYYKKGQAAMTGDAYDEAETYFQKAVDEDPSFAFAWDNLGISLRKNGKYKEAVEAYKKSIAIDPKNATPLQNLPVVYSLLKDYDKSLESYNVLIKTFPDNPEGYFGAGQTYMNGKNDLEKGLDYMCKAYNLYIKMGSPYRTDTEKIINYIYGEMKKQGKEETFNRILKDNNIKY